MKRALIGSGVIVALSFAIVLSVSPQWHERFHSDAKQTQHECAVTLIAAGKYHHATPAPLVSAQAAVVQFCQVPALNPIWVPSPFLGAHIFEHAPPARS